jgi:G8 domain
VCNDEFTRRTRSHDVIHSVKAHSSALSDHMRVSRDVRLGSFHDGTGRPPPHAQRQRHAPRRAAFCASPTVTSVTTGAWSNPKTWSTSKVPTENDKVAIAAGHTVIYDGKSDATIGCIEVRGTLTFRTDANTRLKVVTIMVHTRARGTPPAPSNFCHTWDNGYSGTVPNPGGDGSAFWFRDPNKFRNRAAQRERPEAIPARDDFDELRHGAKRCTASRPDFCVRLQQTVCN